MSTRYLARFVLVAVVAAGSTPALGWGDLGHQIVGAIAIQYLKPVTRQRIVAMLAADTDDLTAHTIVATSNWADYYRDSDRNTTRVRYNATRNWHFVDVELRAPDLNAACFGQPPLPSGTPASKGPANACAANKIDQFLAELKSPNTSPEERLLALKFLLHIVGDMHQPLHSSDDHDSGGNQKNVSTPGLGPGKLHGLWDNEFVELLGSDPFAMADTLKARITTSQAEQWAKGTPSTWALETFAVAKEHAYKLPAPDAQGQYQLSQAYVSDATKVVGIQLSKAGVRLATVLNSAFGQ